MRTFHTVCLTILLAAIAHGQQGTPVRCEILPLPDHQTAFTVDGVEKVRWHFGGQYPRPFFHPFRGPSGQSLTRMGHPGAPNHDHHRSIWLAHHDVEGVNFWSDQTEARIRQITWYGYHDGDEECIMACQLGWYDGAGRELMRQDLVAALSPGDNHEHGFELQLDLRPPTGQTSVRLGQTNFGLLAVRVAKSVSVHFGGGRLSSSEDGRSEAEIFGQRARWIDYSGPLAVGRGAGRRLVTEGITYFDHPDNPRFPAHWHVREDGWMGASLCMREGMTITTDEPLRLRYLLWAHRGAYDAQRAEAVHHAFATRPGFRIAKAAAPHQQYVVRRSRDE